MSTRAFFEDPAKAAVRAAIERVESQTSAELVVAVRRQAGVAYGGVDLGFGALVGFGVLLVLLFADAEFATTWMPVDVAVASVLGAVACRYTRSLRRLLVSGSRRAEETRRAACTAFHELRIGRTAEHNGILVLVGAFERKVAVVPDVGVDPALLRDATSALEAAAAKMDFPAFIAALDRIGPALAEAMPRREDDVNELPDEMGIA